MMVFQRHEFQCIQFRYHWWWHCFRKFSRNRDCARDIVLIWAWENCCNFCINGSECSFNRKSTDHNFCSPCIASVNAGRRGKTIIYQSPRGTHFKITLQPSGTYHEGNSRSVGSHRQRKKIGKISHTLLALAALPWCASKRQEAFW